MIFFDPSLGQAGLEMLSHRLVHNTTSNSMKIAIPKEIKKQEYRVGLLPSVAYQLVQQGHTVLVERGAGVVTGYPDADYEQAGAKLIDDHEALFDEGDLVVKVKEPLPEEYSLMRPGQVLFTYFHLAASRELTEAVCRSAVTAAAYETIEVNAARRFSKQPKAVQRTALHDAVATINAPLLCRSGRD